MTVLGLTPPHVYVLAAIWTAWSLPEVVDDARGSDDGLDLDSNSRVVLSVATGLGFLVGFWLAFRAPAWATFGGLAVPVFWTGVLATVTVACGNRSRTASAYVSTGMPCAFCRRMAISVTCPLPGCSVAHRSATVRRSKTVLSRLGIDFEAQRREISTSTERDGG